MGGRYQVATIQREWTQALGQERFPSLLDVRRRLAVVLDEPIGAADPPEAHQPVKKKRSKVQEKPG